MKKFTPFEKLLYAFTGFTALLIGLRVLYFGSWHYVFLLWNLFLAWLPFVLSGCLHGRAAGWKQWLLLAVWLLFLPNAFYIVTDLVHLRHPGRSPFWLDLAIIFSAAVTGLVMALVSVHRAERFLLRQFSRKVVTVMVGGIFFLSSFGVYLGRYLRWNSWDVITSPLELLQSIAGRIVFPHRHLHTWAVTLVFTGIFTLLYYTLKNLRLQAAEEIKKDG